MKTSIFVFKKMACPPTTYLVTIATDSHQNCVKLCVRDMHSSTENVRQPDYKKMQNFAYDVYLNNGVLLSKGTIV